MTYVYDPLLGSNLVPITSASGAVIGPGTSVIGDIVIFNNNTGSLVADSGVSFPIPPQSGGTGIANNPASTLTISGNFPATFTLTGSTNVTFPTTGTLAITSQIPSLPLSPSNGGTGVANNALSTLTISGNFPATFTLTGSTSVIFPTSGTLATTSQLPSLPLSPASGGTGIANNSASTLTISGNFATTLTVTNTTSVTLPTTGTLATTSQLPSITATQYDVLVGGAANAVVSVGPGSAGQVLQSGGNAANPAYSTATYPATAGTSGNVLTSDGTNWSSVAPAGGGLTYSTITADQTAAVNNVYICNKAGLLTLTMPTTAAQGSIIGFININTAVGARLAAALNVQMNIGNQAATLSTGTLTSTALGDVLYLVCTTANTTWYCNGNIQGNITVV